MLTTYLASVFFVSRSCYLRPPGGSTTKPAGRGILWLCAVLNQGPLSPRNLRDRPLAELSAVPDFPSLIGHGVARHWWLRKAQFAVELLQVVSATQRITHKINDDPEPVAEISLGFRS